jgi:hypothetical protein
VDFLTVGLPADKAARLGSELTAEFESLCRGVEIAAAQADDLAGSGDEAYGMRVFVKHYCVHLAGPDRSADLPAYPADARAARGFNGDIAGHSWIGQHPRWHVDYRPRAGQPELRASAPRTSS